MKTSTIETAPVLQLKAHDIAALAADLDHYHSLYSPLFLRREQRQSARLYLQGLLTQLPRKSIEPMVLSLLGSDANRIRTLQQFISLGAWDDLPILQRHWQQVESLLGEADAALILDGSDFPKQGKDSVGVKRQHCGQLGKTANCQAGVFLAYASRQGYTLLNRRLYLPLDWVEEASFARRRQRCGVPETLTFCTKQQLGSEMIREVLTSKSLRCRWVLGDEAFGHDAKLLDEIAQMGLWYLAEVQHSDRVWLRRPDVVHPEEQAGKKRRGAKQTRTRLAKGAEGAQTVKQIAEQLQPSQWQRLKIKEGSKGPMVADFAVLRVVMVRELLPGPDGWLVLRRGAASAELKAYVSNAPEDVGIEEFARLSGMRWPIERCFEEGKQLLGMGEYEVRTWRGWHHHMTMVMLAHFFLVQVELRMKKKRQE